MRKIVFQNDNYYHVYNRGADKREIFCDDQDYIKFLFKIKDSNQTSSTLSVFPEKNTQCLVDIICYALLPNHYHFILKQITESGISNFMHRLNMSYSKQFNKRYDRKGTLFQGEFQAVQIKSTDLLVYISSYINGNSEIHKIENAQNWKWSSCRDYLGLRNGKICDRKPIMAEFKKAEDYLKYLNESIFESKKIKEDKKKMVIE